MRVGNNFTLLATRTYNRCKNIEVNIPQIYLYTFVWYDAMKCDKARPMPVLN